MHSSVSQTQDYRKYRFRYCWLGTQASLHQNSQSSIPLGTVSKMKICNAAALRSKLAFAEQCPTEQIIGNFGTETRTRKLEYFQTKTIVKLFATTHWNKELNKWPCWFKTSLEIAIFVKTPPPQKKISIPPRICSFRKKIDEGGDISTLWSKTRGVGSPTPGRLLHGSILKINNCGFPLSSPIQVLMLMLLSFNNARTGILPFSCW